MAKSFFFQSFDPADPDNKHFLEDLRKLVDTPDAWERVLQQIGAYVRASSTPAKRLIVEQVAARTDVPAIVIAYHMRCLETLLAAFSENRQERPEHLATDFVELGGIPADRGSALTNLLTLVQQQLAADECLIDEADARNGALPILELVRTTTELRGVFHETDEGKEELRGFVGIVSVQLFLDNEANTYFQCDRGLAEYLIGELELALERLVTLEERQTLNSSAATAQSLSA